MNPMGVIFEAEGCSILHREGSGFRRMWCGWVLVFVVFDKVVPAETCVKEIRVERKDV